MSKFLKMMMLAALFFVPWVSQAQTHYTMQIGSGTATSQYLPDYAYYNYCYTQMLYTSSDVGIDGMIDTLAFQVSSNSTTRNVTIYMAEVAQTTLSSQVSASQFTQVFSGSVTWNQGWTVIALDSVFEYQDTGSLVIALIDGTGSYVSSYTYFSGTTMSDTKSRYVYNDGSPYTLSSSLGSTSTFRPNIRLGISSYSSYCAAPSDVVVGDIINDEATISWVENGDASTYEVVVSDVALGMADLDNASSFIAYDTFYTVNNLGSNTLYYVYVRALCDASSTSAWTAAVNFRSACAGYTTIPYTTGFEDVSNGNMPNCWLQLATGTSGAGTFPSGYNYATNARNGNIYFEMESSSGQTEVAALPAMENLNNLMLTFYASCMNTNFTLEAGVMEGTSFVPVETVQLTAGTGGNWHGSYYPYTVYFANYSGSGERMALRVTSSGSYTLMIDDLTVDYIPGCPNPSNFTLDSVGTDWAALSWNENGSASNWMLEYDTVDFVPGAGSGATSMLVQSNEFLLSGLDSGQTYHVYVRSDCNGDTSTYISLTFSTLVGAPASVPFSCDFEQSGVNGWNLVNGTQSNYWMVGTAANNGGNKGLYITNDGNTNGYSNTNISYTYAIRNINLYEAGEYVYSYDWRNQGESHYYDFIRVFLAPASAEFNAGSVLGGSTYSFSTYTIPATWFDLSGITSSPWTLAQSSNWQNVTGTFTLTTPGSYQLVFAWANDGSGGSNPAAAIDNVQLIRNTCPAPINLTVSNVTTTDITVNWQTLGDENEWEVFDGTNSYLATDTTYTITNLTPDHNYTIRVRAICDIDDTSMAVSTVARTLQSCVRPVGITVDSVLGDTVWVSWTDTTSTMLYDLVYGYAGFDPDTVIDNIETGITANNFMFTGLTMGQRYDFYVRNDCGGEQSSWVGPASAVPSYTYTMAATGTDTIHVCGYTIYDNGGETGDYSANCNSTLVVYPSDNTQTLQISGSGYVESSYDHLYIYDGIGNSGTELYHGQGTFTIPAINSESGVITIVFTSDGSVNYSGYEISVACVPLPDCSHPTQLSANNIGTQSADITWVEPGTASSWIIQYDNVNFTPGSNNNANSVVVSTNPYTLTGLDSAMTYYVYVASYCNPDTSDFYGFTFTTLAGAPATVPFSCDFETAGANGWDFIQGSQNNYWIVGNAVNNGGSRSMYVTDNGTSNNYSGNASYSFAVRTFNLAAGSYICSYDWKCNGESSYDFLRAALVPESTNITAGDYSGFNNESAMPAGSIALDGGYRQNLQTTWQNQVTEFTIASAGNYKFVFLWRNDGSVYNNPPAAIDNVQLILNTCPMPENITLDNLTQASTDVSWVESGSATTWEYQIGNLTPVITTDTFCTVTGLTSNTVYAFRVRSICGQGDTSMWATYNFRTPCGYITLPYMQDFEAESTGSTSTGSAFVNCMTRLNNGTSYGGYPYVSSSTTYNHTVGGTKGLYWYNTTTSSTFGDYQVVVLPPVDPQTGVNTLQLSFWTKTSSSSYIPDFQIGVMTDPNNLSTFVGVDTITVTSGTTWMNIEVPLIAYTGAGQYVAIKADRASWTAYVDDIELDLIPTCPKVVNIHSVSASSSSVSIDWTEIGNAQTWEVVYGDPGFNLSQGTSIIATSHPFTITGLNTLTSYDVYVRPICGAGDTGYWASASIQTAMCDNSVEALNYVDSLQNSSTSSYSPVGFSIYNYSYVQTIIPAARLTDISGDVNAFSFNAASTSAGTYFTNMTVWLANVTEDNLSSGFIHPDSAHVFQMVIDNADFSYTTTGWQLHGFDSVFTWDGTSNILVAVNREHGSWTSGSSFVAHIDTVARMRYVYQDGSAYNPATVSGGAASTTVGDIKLISCGGGCAKPANLSATNVTYNGATLNWAGNADTYEVRWKAATAGVWPDPVTVNNATSYTVTGLVSEAQYQFQVRAICDATENLISDWAIGSFTTDDLPCFAPTALQADPDYTSAELTWTAGGIETQWRIHVWNSDFNETFESSATTYTVTGLAQTISYYAAVQSVCGNGAAESEYGDTIQFTTATCQQVTGVTATVINATTAVVTWDDAQVDSYILNYGGIGHGSGTGQNETVSGTSFTITGLSPETGYSVYVRAVCAQGAEGAWSAAAEFTTPELDGIDNVDGVALSIYPNPTSSTTTIALSGVTGTVEVNIVDMNGRVVMSDSMSCEGDCAKTMEVSGLAQGAYFVRISGENVNMVKKLVVK